jgi:fibronectin type 3 domain-containing protein
LFAEHHINVPEDAGDVLDSLSEEAKDAKAQLNDATERNIELAEKVKSYQRQDIISEACKGLAATETAKLTELAEAVEADDNEQFTAKVATIKESYLNKDATVEATPEVDAITEATQETQDVSANMQRYLSAIERTK